MDYIQYAGIDLLVLKDIRFEDRLYNYVILRCRRKRRDVVVEIKLLFRLPKIII